MLGLAAFGAEKLFRQQECGTDRPGNGRPALAANAASRGDLGLEIRVHDA
jgi:hypothetical protein